MKPTTRRTISWGALALAVVLAAAAFWAMRAKTAMERQLAAMRAEGERLETVWRARSESRVIGERTGAAGEIGAKAVPPATAVPGAAAAAPTAQSFPPRVQAPGLMDLARDNPQLWNEFIAAKRIELGRFFLPVMQRLNLTPAQRERVRDILTSELARSTDINTAGNVQGLAFEDPALEKLRAESSAQRKRELTEVLGTKGVQELEDFERATPMRGAVDGFAVEVARIAPLTGAQADQLERALAQANAAYRKGEHAVAGELDWTEADRRAQTILTPQQFAIWKRGLAHNSFGSARNEQELHRVYDRAVERGKR